MKTTEFVCDRCGHKKDTENSRGWKGVHWSSFWLRESLWNTERTAEKHLCGYCAHELRDFLKNIALDPHRRLETNETLRKETDNAQE